jgi:BASS family bile acid:Na+ symporter
MLPLLHHLEKFSVIVFLVASMGASGLTLTPQALLRPLRDARLVLCALFLNFVVAPAFAWALTMVIPLERGHAAGLLLLGGAAGAPFLPKVFATARCDQALAAALMGLLTAGTILFLPFVLPLMIPGLQADAWGMARPLVYFIVLPLAAGMLLRNFSTALSTRGALWLGKLGSLSLVVLILTVIALNARPLLGVLGSGAIFAAAIYFAGLFAIGEFVGRAAPPSGDALALTTTARNFGAALAPAASSFGDPKVTLMIIVGAIVCLGVSFVAAGWVRRKMPSPSPQATT